MKSSSKTLPSAPPGRLNASAAQILEDLNPAQREAVLFGDGPLLIVAGAGTGKTTVLSKRIAHLIVSKKALPSEILALTFTDKAATEMEDRIDRLVPYGFNDVWVSTFHSFGDRILRENAFEIGLSSDLKVLTQAEAVVFMRQHLFEFELEHYRPLADPTRFIESLLSAFSRAKDEEVSPADYLRAAEEMKGRASTEEEEERAAKTLEVAKAYKTYEDFKREKGFIDFGDQVVLALRLLRERPTVLRKYQEQFKYILVDEFQDTNYAQFEVFKLLAGSRRNITVVGDDDQSIYKFRGACLSNILGFRKAFPEAKEIVLQENYRSNQEVLDSSYRLIQHNNPDRLEYRDRIGKFLRASRGPGGIVGHIHFDTIFSETSFVASKVKERIEAGKNEPKDFAILVRANGDAEPFIKALSAAGVPWRFSGNAGLYEQEEVRMALSFLRVIDQPADSASLYYLAISPMYEVDPDDLATLSQLSAKTKRSLMDIFKVYAAKGGKSFAEDSVTPADFESILRGRDAEELLAGQNLGISAESQMKVEKVVTDVQEFRRQASKMPTGNLLYKFFEDGGFLKRLAESTDWRSAQQAQNLYHFFGIIKRFGQVSAYDRAHYFIQYVDSLRLAGEDPASAQASFEENAVNILTVHAAKGLEFPVVFMVSLEQGSFPVTGRREPIELPDSLIKDILPQGNVHVQEERRLFYVGMTRAKDELYLCSARDQGGKKQWKVSQFVLEALDKPSAGETTFKSNPLDELKIFSSSYAQQIAMTFPNDRLFSDAGNMSLQVTGIQEYLDCPLKYKFARVLRIPVLMHHTAVFGVAIHEALKAYHLARREGRKMELDDLLAVFKRNWASEGFVSREHEEKRFQEGQKVLKAYYKKEEESGAVPTHVEEDFRLVLDDVRIRGRWDRVDVNGDGAVIIDYKTGDVKDQKDADQKAKQSVQLLFYAYAYQNRFQQLPGKTVLHFIKKDLIGTAVPTEEKVAKTVETTRQVIADIKAQKFEPTPGYHCRWCAYEKICPSVDKTL